MDFPLVPKLVILSDLGPHNGSFFLFSDLDSRLAYPRPKPRLSSFKTKTETLMSKTKSDRDSRLTRPILEVHDRDGL